MTASITVAEATIAVTYDGIDRYTDGYCYEERRRYVTVITTPEWEYTDNTLLSGVGAAVDEWKMLDAILDYLQAAAEAYRYWMDTSQESENYDLFPPYVTEWAYLVEDELSSAQCDLHDAAHGGELR